jgi:hypothetical protein
MRELSMMGSGSLFSNGLNGFCGERKQMRRCGHQPCTLVTLSFTPAPLNSRNALEALGSDDRREVACALDAIRQRGRLARDRDGRYHLGQFKPGHTGILGELYHDPNDGT